LVRSRTRTRAFSKNQANKPAYWLMQVSALMADAVHGVGRRIKSFTDDGVVTPSLEDAPLRGCRAALKIRERIATKATDLEMKHGLRPRMRTGINAGPIIVGKEREAVKASVSSDVQPALCALPQGRSPRLRGTNESDRWMHLQTQTHSARSARARLPAARRLPVGQRYASCSGTEQPLL
jgi:hypothetical protein